MPTRTFNATPDQMAKLRSELASEGIMVPLSDSGVIDSGMGFEIDFNYDEVSKLTIDVLNKTCWLPTTSQIFDQIQAHLSS